MFWEDKISVHWQRHQRQRQRQQIIRLFLCCSIHALPQITWERYVDRNRKSWRASWNRKYQVSHVRCWRHAEILETGEILLSSIYAFTSCKSCRVLTSSPKHTLDQTLMGTILSLHPYEATNITVIVISFIIFILILLLLLILSTWWSSSPFSWWVGGSQKLGWCKTNYFFKSGCT